MYFIFIILLAVTFGAEVPNVRYDGFQVFRIVPENDEQLQNLGNLQVQNRNYTFWNGATYVKQTVDIMVPPELVKNFKNSLIPLKLTATVITENIQHSINKVLFGDNSTKNDFNWKRYHDLNQIYRWLQSLVVKYPKLVTLIQGGVTHEGRNITGVRISYKEGNRAIFIEGGIHACERISPATSTYIINQLLTSKDPNVREIAESRTWFVFPVVNPDGYEYTKIDVFWRKNRNPTTSQCIGVDLNRNWGYKWMHGGASKDPCNSVYAGDGPFSEIESRSLSKFIDTIAHSIEGYISFHSYSQVLLIPFGHDGNEVPRNNDELLRIGKIAMTALAERYGTKYRVGNIPQVFSVASGNSIDWVMGFHRSIKFVYAYELRDQGEYGFLLPPEQIIPTGEETLDSLVSIIQQISMDEEGNVCDC